MKHHLIHLTLEGENGFEKMLNRMPLDAALMSGKVQTALQNLPEPERYPY